MLKVAIYPGTFDPITKGHFDIIERALLVVDKLYVAVAVDSSKNTVFMPDERVDLIKSEIVNSSIADANITVTKFSGLLVNFAANLKAGLIIRGIRAVSDFEYEFQMSCMNQKLKYDIQTIFLPASEKMQLISSRLVREVTRLGGDVGEFASDNVKNKLKEYYSNH